MFHILIERQIIRPSNDISSIKIIGYQVRKIKEHFLVLAQSNLSILGVLIIIYMCMDNTALLSSHWGGGGAVKIKSGPRWF